MEKRQVGWAQWNRKTLSHHEHSVDMMLSGHKIDHIAVAVVQKWVVVVDSTGSAVGNVAVVRKVAAPAAGSIEPVVLVLDMATEAACLVAVEVVYYTPTALEDMVMMIRKSSGSAME
jgi:hypothetical protein